MIHRDVSHFLLIAVIFANLIMIFLLSWLSAADQASVYLSLLMGSTCLFFMC